MRFKNIKILAVSFIAAAILALFVPPTDTASAATDGRYRIDSLTVDAVVNSDYTVDITEVFEINFLTPLSSFLRDIPAKDGGIRVENIRAVASGGAPVREISVSFDSGFLVVDMDSTNYTPSTGTKKYALAYTLVLPKKQASSDQIALNLIGTGFNTEIYNAKVNVWFPDTPSFTKESIYVGTRGNQVGAERVEYSVKQVSQGDSRYLATFDIIRNSNDISLYAYEGLTVGFDLPAGTFSARTDVFSIIVIIIAVSVIVLAFLLYSVIKNKVTITPVVNFAPPKGIDPAQVGHLIDGNCSAEDITALIYYWANQGYIGINMQKRSSDTVLYKLRDLPNTAMRHERVVFSRLFGKGNQVQIASLTNNFYSTIETAKADVRAQYSGKLYDKKSIGMTALFTAIAVLFTTIAAFAFGIKISTKFINPLGFLSLIPMAICFLFAFVMFMYQPKQFGKSATMVLYLIAAVLLNFVAVFLYIHIALLPIASAIACAAFGLAICIMLPALFKRKSYYVDMLNQLIGFKNFIELAEKERLEALLEENPNYYYDILPYAQVLGVSDIWMNKFKALSVQPPYWMSGDRLVSFIVFNSLFRNTFRTMSTTFVSRPSSSGGGGRGGFGGRGGGFSGGGFGGGGGRVR